MSRQIIIYRMDSVELIADSRSYNKRERCKMLIFAAFPFIIGKVEWSVGWIILFSRDSPYNKECRLETLVPKPLIVS